MLLSVVIVNYNVKYFLEQCLSSLQPAIKGLEAEVIVVDNDSSDGSMDYLPPKFPWVIFVPSKKNLGFGKANNLAFQMAKGKYILILNPDTLLPENSLQYCLQQITNDPAIGALGIRMLDGRGGFLPESKRAFPSPWVSLLKMSGIATLFPRSGFFNRYALGNLDPAQNHEVDVLAGAFILIPKHICDGLKGFDEDFFMYGEDIDLSYRIKKLGYKNIYVGQSCIIHFKGESTKKGSLNYVWMFYNAMVIFVKKHYSGGAASIYVFIIQLAILLSGLLDYLKSRFIKAGLPILDAICIYASLLSVKGAWVSILRNGIPFFQSSLGIWLLVYTSVFYLSAILSGIYDNLYKPSKAILSCAIGVVFMLATYSLFPESLRFSRGLMLIGGITASFSIMLNRQVLSLLKWISPMGKGKDDGCIIVGSKQGYEKVLDILSQSGQEKNVIGQVEINGNGTGCMGNISALKQIISDFSITEVIFCHCDLSYAQIIDTIQSLPNGLHYRFWGEGTNSIVGSDNKSNSGEAFALGVKYPIASPYQKRMKRILDVTIGLLLLLISPFIWLFRKKARNVFRQAIDVILCNKTWVGYIVENNGLPPLKKSVFSHKGPQSALLNKYDKDLLTKMDSAYAEDYDWLDDLLVIQRLMKNYFYIHKDQS